MREIKAIIQPFLLSIVVEALKGIEGLPGLTVSEVQGFGGARAAGCPGAFLDGTVEYVKKSKLEVVVPDVLAEKVIQVIREHAHTGNAGDGKIFVHRLDEVVRIRTGDRGESAI